MLPPSSQAQLLRRARQVAELEHPHLVRMLSLPGGAGLSPAADQGRVLSDFTPGGTFKRFELDRVLPLLLDVLSGLSALHAVVEDGRGFVHGEVSPRYIYVGDDGRARLVPLVSRHFLPQSQPSATGYAAPELLLGDQIDARADIFSVGVMLWEALAKRPLFPDPSLEAVVMRLLGGEIPPLTAPPRNPWALPLCAIAECAISTYPALRFESAEELSEAIQRAVRPQAAQRGRETWQDDAPTLLLQMTRPSNAGLRTFTPLSSVLDLSPAGAAVTEPLPESASPVTAPRGRPRASRWSRLGDVMLALVVLVALAATVVLLFTKPSPSAPPPAAAAAPAPAAPAPAPSSQANPAASPNPSASGVPSLGAKRRERSTKRGPAPDDYGI